MSPRKFQTGRPQAGKGTGTGVEPRRGKTGGRSEKRARRTESTAPDRGGSDTTGWAALAVATAGIGMAGGFYTWMLSGPVPQDGAALRTPPRGVFNGLPLALAIGLGGAFVVLAVLTMYRPARPLRDRLVVVAGGFYLAGLTPVAGCGALFLAPAVVLGALVLSALLKRESRPDTFLLALHAGGFGTALCFFHQWARYRDGLGPFLKNLSALGRLWL